MLFALVACLCLLSQAWTQRTDIDSPVQQAAAEGQGISEILSSADQFYHNGEDRAHEWNYNRDEDIGPGHWGDYFPHCNQTFRDQPIRDTLDAEHQTEQSPININTSAAENEPFKIWWDYPDNPCLEGRISISHKAPTFKVEFDDDFAEFNEGEGEVGKDGATTSGNNKGNPKLRKKQKNKKHPKKLRNVHDFGTDNDNKDMDTDCDDDDDDDDFGTYKLRMSGVGKLINLSDDTFILEQFHFHFSNQSMNGSEHKLNGIRYDSEVHFVHFNSKYGSFDNAGDKTDGLAVLAAFLQVESEPNHCRDSEKMNKVLKEFYPCVEKDDYEARLRVDILEKDVKRDIYMYKGSTTSPSCHEHVLWFVIQDPISIKQDHMNMLRRMKYHEHNEGELIVKHGNYRPIQAYYPTHVFKNFQ